MPARRQSTILKRKSFVTSADAAKSLYKYRQRSIDNLKRVYAIVLSISVGKYIEFVYNSMTALFYPSAGPIGDPGRDFGAQCVIGVILISTLSVFYFNQDKILDLEYGFDPNDGRLLGAGTLGPRRKGAPPPPSHVTVLRWLATPFMVNYLIVLMTLLFFPFMAFTSSAASVSHVGMRDFFISYIFLLTGGSLMAGINASVSRLADEGSRQDQLRGQILAINWTITNSLAVLLLGLPYLWLGLDRLDCTIGPCLSAGHWFACLFVIVATARNFLDWRGSWPLLGVNRMFKFNTSPRGGIDFSRWTITYWLVLWHNRRGARPDIGFDIADTYAFLLMIGALLVGGTVIVRPWLMLPVH